MTKLAGSRPKSTTTSTNGNEPASLTDFGDILSKPCPIHPFYKYTSFTNKNTIPNIQTYLPYILPTYTYITYIAPKTT